MDAGNKLGEGGEAEVFALDDGRVLRRFRTRDADVDGRLTLTREVAAATGDLPFSTPEVLDQFVDDDGFPCLIERRLPGRPMTEALADMTDGPRQRLLSSYLQVGATIGSASFARPWFGELISQDPMRRGTWPEYLHDALDRQLDQTDRSAYPELGNLDALAGDAHRKIDATDFGPVEPRLVHFDYFGGNVLCDDERITAVIDWSVLSIAGDPRLDVAMSVAFLGLTPNATAADQAAAERWLADQLPADVIDTYRRWVPLWWMPMHDDARLRHWIVGRLSA